MKSDLDFGRLDLCGLCGATEARFLAVEENPAWLCSHGRYTVEPYCFRCIAQAKARKMRIIEVAATEV